MRHLSWLLLSVVLLGCPADPEDSDTGDSDDTDTGDTDTADTAVPIEPIGLYPVFDLGYDIRLTQTGTTEPCEIDIDGTIAGYQGIDCQLEVNELDLYGNGLDFGIVIPFGACDYLVYHHYQYEAFEVGAGPTTAEYQVDSTGNIIDVENTVNGRPFCEYDYSFANDIAPNCCTGSYTLSIENVELGQTNTIGPIEWGGNPADCYDGAAYWDPEALFSDEGWPLGKIVFLDQDRYEKRFHWDMLAINYFSNVPLANYYVPADHGGTMPAGLAGDYAHPYYTFQCYDHAEELLGQIRLTVREWNEQAEFYALGDPETEGTEPVSLTPIDDRMDWATATPGNASWIGFAQ